MLQRAADFHPGDAKLQSDVLSTMNDLANGVNAVQAALGAASMQAATVIDDVQ